MSQPRIVTVAPEQSKPKQEVSVTQRIERFVYSKNGCTFLFSVSKPIKKHRKSTLNSLPYETLLPELNFVVYNFVIIREIRFI